MTDTSANNKLIAKNTMLLYVRTFFVMLVSLFTSRVTLQVLGVDNYGIQSAVGGVIGMFSVISGSLSGAISRFLTFEIGHGNAEKLKRIFCTSINIQIGISLIILVLFETIGLWFLNTKMVIPEGRLTAANWVFQCSVISFIIGLFSVPFNASIIGHEKMSAFAYVSIVEVVLKLVIVYMLYVSPFDKLISLSVLSVVVALIINGIYAIYCRQKFEECRYELVWDKPLLKEMTGFAGWSFLTNIIWVLNTQGISVLINLFFGVAFNAARGVASMVEGVLKKFTTDFTTAFNPQITKSYAVGNTEQLFVLINRGARFSYFLMLLLALPFMFEAQFVLDIWLDIVPDNSVSFFRLSIIATMVMLLGDSGTRACMATGNIRNYTLVMTAISVLVFPLTYFAFKMGCPAEWAYIAYIAIYSVMDIVRLYLMKNLIDYHPSIYFKEVLLPVLIVTVVAVIPPFILNHYSADSVLHSLAVMFVSVCSSMAAIFYLGITKREREVVISKIKETILKFRHR